MNRRRSAVELIDLVLDPGSFESWDETIDRSSYSPAYGREVEAATERAGTDESVLTGCGRVGGHRVAVVVSEFRFLAGSIGRGTARRIVAAVRRHGRRPSVAGDHRIRGHPHAGGHPCLRRDDRDHPGGDGAPGGRAAVPGPSTEPDHWWRLCLVGVAGSPDRRPARGARRFLGPKVFQALNGEAFPAGVQTAENLAAKGVIDAVIDDEDLRTLVDRALAVLVGSRNTDPASPGGTAACKPFRLERDPRDPASRPRSASATCCAMAVPTPSG